MKIIHAWLGLVVLLVAVDSRAADWTINYCNNLSLEAFHDTAEEVLRARLYQIEKDSPSTLIATQKGKKVEISLVAPGTIVIRWVPGYGYKKDNWIKNLKLDMLQALAVKAESGERRVQWCRDVPVKTLEFAVRQAVRDRQYTIEEDTGSRLVASQKDKKIEISMGTAGNVLIRWVPGFGYAKDNWLDNLSRDIVWKLAE